MFRIGTSRARQSPLFDAEMERVVAQAELVRTEGRQ
jgi:hypothetical protein